MKMTNSFLKDYFYHVTFECTQSYSSACRLFSLLSNIINYFQTKTVTHKQKNATLTCFNQAQACIDHLLNFEK